MASKATVSMGFRLSEEEYEVVKTLASKQKRSIANVLQLMVSSSISQVEKDGWASVMEGANE